MCVGGATSSLQHISHKVFSRRIQVDASNSTVLRSIIHADYADSDDERRTCMTDNDAASRVPALVIRAVYS